MLLGLTVAKTVSPECLFSRFQCHRILPSNCCLKQLVQSLWKPHLLPLCNPFCLPVSQMKFTCHHLELECGGHERGCTELLDNHSPLKTPKKSMMGEGLFLGHVLLSCSCSDARRPQDQLVLCLPMNRLRGQR